MAPKQKRIVTVCLILLVAAMAIMIVNLVIKGINDGWDQLGLLDFAPFVGFLVALIAVLVNGKKKDSKE